MYQSFNIPWTLSVLQVSHLQVEHLIERFLLLYMDQEECEKAIAQHADVNPIVTRTVWNGLLKENGIFFSAYEWHRADRHDLFSSQALVAARAKLMQRPNQRNENRNFLIISDRDVIIQQHDWYVVHTDILS